MTRTIEEIKTLSAEPHEDKELLLILEEANRWMDYYDLQRANEDRTEQKQEQSSISSILAERESRYGSFKSHATITQVLKTEMKSSPKWWNLSDSQKEALEMIAHKIGRILNGDPNYLDSWVDLAGYAQLVVNELNEEGDEK